MQLRGNLDEQIKSQINRSYLSKRLTYQKLDEQIQYRCTLNAIHQMQFRCNLDVI